MADTIVVRQPIFNSSLQVIAYQALFFEPPWLLEGQHEENPCNLTKFFADSNFVSVLGDNKPLHLVLTYEQLQNFSLDKIPRSNVVINIDAFWLYNKRMVELVHELKESGYLVALRNVNTVETVLPIMGIVDMLNFTVAETQDACLARQYKDLKAIRGTYIAEEIQTLHQFEFAKSLGIKYFHGRFLLNPTPELAKSVSTNKMLLLRLISELQGDDAEARKISGMLEQDARLSYQILNICNSAFYNLPREVHSIHEAVVMIGIAQMRHWGNMVVLSNLSSKPHALLVQTMLRAKHCELLALNTRHALPSSCFTCGLFSTLDAMLDRPLNTLVDDLPLIDEIKVAITEHQGPIGEVLATVIAFEGALWDRINPAKMPLVQVSSTYKEALLWVKENCESFCE